MVEFVMQERCDGVVFDSEKSGLDGEAVSGFEKVVSGSLQCLPKRYRGCGLPKRLTESWG